MRIRYHSAAGLAGTERRMAEIERVVAAGGGRPAEPGPLGELFSTQAPWGYVDLLFGSGGDDSCRAVLAVSDGTQFPFRNVTLGLDLPSDTDDRSLLRAYGRLLPGAAGRER